MSKRASPELWLKLKPLAREKRRAPTRTEDALWSALRDRKLSGLKFRRQHTIERFIVDFYCAECRLVIEVDGPIHERTPGEDRIRQEFLESLALEILRFTNVEIETNISDVLAKISEKTLAPPSEAPPLHVVERGLGGEVHAPPDANAPSPAPTPANSSGALR